MKLSLFDTHCDTAYELFHRGLHLDANEGCHISLEKAADYECYAQYYAVWSNRRKDDEACWEDFLSIAANLKAEIDRVPHLAALVASPAELEETVKAGKHAAILAVEDARLCAGKPERVDTLASMGVKYMTLLWGGDTCVGGSHDTRNGLTDFGKALARRCFEVGIVPDVSHSSEEAVDDLLPIAYEFGKPIIASHSNSHAVYGHTRNLRDRHFAAIKELGGVVGLSLCTSHLTNDGIRPATPEDVFVHAEHYLALGGEDMLGFGCDWDGTGLPVGMSRVNDLYQVAEIMAAHNYSEELIHKLFWKNFYDFAMKNL